MIIREAEQQDNKELAAIIRSAFEEFNAPRSETVYSDPTTDDLYALFQRSGAGLWVAVTDVIAGCCGIFPTDGLPPGCAELVKFYLSPSARGKGIGKALMEQCTEKAKAMGYSSLYIESTPEFISAVRLYQKQGFVRLNHPLGHSGHTGCSIWMRKEL